MLVDARLETYIFQISVFRSVELRWILSEVFWGSLQKTWSKMVGTLAVYVLHGWRHHFKNSQRSDYKAYIWLISYESLDHFIKDNYVEQLFHTSLYPLDGDFDRMKSFFGVSRSLRLLVQGYYTSTTSVPFLILFTLDCQFKPKYE